MSHRWQFFRVGGVEQVSLRDGRDLLGLPELDQKLWTALAMPVNGVDIDPVTLGLIDLDNDGRIRVKDLLATIAWIKDTFTDPGQLLTSADQVKLSAIKDAKVVATAKQMLKDLGKAGADVITVAGADAITTTFEHTVLNGDGIVIAGSTEDEELQKVIVTAIECTGEVIDRSGKPGVDQAHADELFAAVDQRHAWLVKGTDAALRPLGEGTAAAADALAAVQAKLDDYYTRCRIAAFDARGAGALAGQDTDFTALASRVLTSDDDDLARLPLSRIDPAGRLQVDAGLNPAWAARIATFVQAAVVPILGPRPMLGAADVDAIVERLAGYTAWQNEKPATKVDALEPAWLTTLAGEGPRARLKALIESDAALKDEYDQITNVVKAVRLQRDLPRIVRNFVNFSDFYSRQDGAFQAGTLYIDGRALHLCVPVTDAGKHAKLAGASDAHLVYCDITRKGETKQIAAALTNGDVDNVVVGRNGVFYDRKGDDWDATVAKIIANPVSVRAAFWTPYKRLAKAIEDNITKRATAAETASSAKIDAAGKYAATAEVADAKAPPPAAPKKIDLGTVAAIGVAVGGIGTLFGALLAAMFGLGPWLPLGVAAIILMISLPSMVLAWLKLRRRNLGPILDANGWAINGRARVNVQFGAQMTELARLPKGSQRVATDPYADKRSKWKLWVFLLTLVALAGLWYVGKLDRYLPTSISSVEVLGANAPAARAAAAAAKAAATPAAPAPAPAPAP